MMLTAARGYTQTPSPLSSGPWRVGNAVSASAVRHFLVSDIKFISMCSILYGFSFCVLSLDL